jgi:hypothetical protein
MFKSMACSALLLGLWLPVSQASSTDLAPPSVDVMTWPRMSVGDFGCYMEKTLGYRDKRFNCALKGYKNQGDACTNPRAYYEGPAFPKALVAKVHPLATDVELDWERGELQQVTITLKGAFSEQDARKAFKLPVGSAYDMEAAHMHATLPENVEDTDVQFPGRELTAVIITGFDHMGAGDVDCAGGGGGEGGE